MRRALFYRLFGLGKIPDALMAELVPELIEASDEGIHGSLTYKNFKAPGRRDALRRIWFVAAIAVTGERLVALQAGTVAINVPFADERIRKMEFSIEHGKTLVVAFDASLFHDDWSGQLAYRFKTDQAQALLSAIQGHIS